MENITFVTELALTPEEQQWALDRHAVKLALAGAEDVRDFSGLVEHLRDRLRDTPGVRVPVPMKEILRLRSSRD